MRKHCKNLYWLLALLVSVLLCTEGGLALSNIDIKGPEDNQSNSKLRSVNVDKESGTELIPDPVSTLLLVSTLDGSLTALDRLSGQIRWISKDEPMIRVPSSSGQSETVRPPYFLPDPKSGELYILGRHRHLKKLPFTIPQLVSMSPCRSTEGLLYTGKKMDMWLLLNPNTGEKSEMLPNSQTDSTCPAPDGSASKNSDGSPATATKPVLIGKSEYTISMMDGPRKWNVTFHDYSSVDMNQQSLLEYNLVHFTSPSTGAVVTYERESGQLLWQTELDTPVIALYTIDCTHSTLTSVPFQSIAVETLNRLKVAHDTRDNNQLSPTLYVGECPYGLYAVPSLVDDTVLPISEKTTELPYLIEGPTTEKHPEQPKEKNVEEVPEENVKETEGDIIIFGHYEVPENPELRVPPIRQITAEIDPNSEENLAGRQFNESDTDRKVIPADKNKLPEKENKINGKGRKKDVTENKIRFPPPPEPPHKRTLNKRDSIQPENRKEKPYLVVTTAVVTTVVTVAVISLGYVTVTTIKRHKNSGNLSEPSSQKSLSKDEERDTFPDSSEYPLIQKKNSSPDGSIMTIGKISFEPGSVLGKGCEGTFVFKGKFENRDVAVKRILPECFAFADREVDLLKESDQHANVIRYFCTESDGQFRYIALELCSATLNDWVEGKFCHDSIRPLEILREATDGLAHLHSLNIVHRDIKPANVLLTVCPSTKKVRTMISDFGLCKKLANGRASFSRRSGGIPGTDGWIAPEVVRNLNSQPERMTHSVDIFSLGCVYYYVLTKGDHPFGDPFRRQSNILNGESTLDKIADNPQGVEELVRLMIGNDASARPPLAAILEHPMFWSEEKILSFFLDVSDRIEKENETCSLLRKLEMDAENVVRKDWRDHICSEVAMDLRRYRTYKGHSVRDLLRALRNKKNHYRELTQEAQASLGQIPNQFVLYWLTRFPSLLPRSWSAFESVKSEPIFSKYYHTDYFFYEWSDDMLISDSYNCCDTNNILSTNSYSPQNEFNKPDSGIDGDWRSDISPEKTTGSPQKKLDKNFWKSKSQYKYNKWKRQQQANFNPNTPIPNPGANVEKSAVYYT